MVTNNMDIKGITICTHDYRLSQFADDTTLLLDGTARSLQAALNTLEIFGSMSGLIINKDKTKLIWIGRKKHSKDKLKTKFPLQWGETAFDLLGLKFSVNLSEMINLNYNKYIEQAKSIINHWNKRYLTPLGKITVIKTFILSKFIHLFTTLPSPNAETIKKINTMIFNFLWEGKPDKVKRAKITQTYSCGGLKMTDITLFISSLKITWLRRLINADDHPWARLFEDSCFKISNFHKLDILYIRNIINRTRNPFWIDVFNAWIQLSESTKPKSNTDYLTSSLWMNPNISKHPLYFPNWFNKGITTVGDLISNQATIFNLHELSEKYDLTQTNFLEHYRIKSLVETFTKKVDLLNNRNLIYLNQRPYIPHRTALLLKSKKGTKDFYNALHNKKLYTIPKWEQDLQIQIEEESWYSIHNKCFRTVKDNYLIWFQYKILNRILGVRKYLNTLGITNNSLCQFCKTREETLKHLFYDCIESKKLWTNVKTWIISKMNFNLSFTGQLVILGYLHQDSGSIPLNTVLLVTKSYIFWCSRHEKLPNIFDLQKRIQRTYTEQKYIAIKNNSLAKFEKNWNTWTRLF